MIRLFLDVAHKITPSRLYEGKGQGNRGTPAISAIKLTLVTVGLLLVSACSATAEQVFPTPMPTRTATIPVTSSPTSVPSPTFNAINPPAATAGPSPSPLLVSGPTLPLFTPTQTQVALLPGALQIQYFAAKEASVKPGGQVTLFWAVSGTDKVAIYRLNPGGIRGKLWTRPRTGTLQVDTLLTDTDTAQFLLTIESNGQSLDQTLSVQIECSGTGGWFFQPAPPGCAPVTPIASGAVEQPFEHGRMIWMGGEQRVYVLFNDGKQPAWTYYTDEYKDGQPATDPKISPPQDKFQPTRGFGLIWRTKPHVRDRLGWGTAAEISFAGEIQGDATNTGGTAYLRTRDGNIIQLLDNGTSWKLVTP